jgi:cytochrome c biogenesis protein CcmG, thiol:disulfide interchange protein DsbE
MRDPASAGYPCPERRRLLQILAACAAGGILTWPVCSRADGPPVGKPAPPLTLHTLDGRTISTDALRGKVVILSFWATWCEPCQEELPLLSDYAARHAAQGLQVLGFSLDDPADLAAVRKVASGLSFPVGLLGGSYAGDYGRIWRLPANFTIDRGGILVDNTWNADVPQWTRERLERVVSPLLTRPSENRSTS